MTLNLFKLAIVSMFILVIMGVISNTNNKTFTEVENQIFLMNCPYPINAGIASNLVIQGLTITYDIIPDNATSDYHMTVFECSIDSITGNRQVNTVVYETANNWFNINTGYLAYLMNYIMSFGQKAVSALTLFSFILTPANFTILGYTLADLGGLAMAFVVMLYLFSYAMIITWLWVTFNPFKGGSG